jgi:hypothetical protein
MPDQHQLFFAQSMVHITCAEVTIGYRWVLGVHFFEHLESSRYSDAPQNKGSLTGPYWVLAGGGSA